MSPLHGILLIVDDPPAARKLQLALKTATCDLPTFHGPPVEVSVQNSLTVSGGKLHSGHSRGTAVSAASFLVERRMVLDTELLQDAGELRRILVHELFHFVWRRLGNVWRREWHSLMEAERQARARGELGWSAEWRKNALRQTDAESNSRRWRQYVCESFCDTAGWYFGNAHPEHTLANRHRRKRAEWLRRLLAGGSLPV